MSKTTVNVLITIVLLIVLAVLFFFTYLPVLISMAANTLYVALLFSGIILLIYGLYKLVSYINR